MSERTNGFDKYSHFVDKTTNYSPTPTYGQILVEKIWGKDRSAQRFESALHNYEQLKYLQNNPRWAKKLGAAEATTKLHKAEGGSMFHGPLFFGSQQVEFDVIYDTGSDWVTVEGKNCTNCKGDTYDSTQSS